MLLRGSEVQCVGDGTQLLELGVVHDVARVEALRVEARSPAEVGACFTGTLALGEGGGAGDQRHAPATGLEVGRIGRFFQRVAHASVGHAETAHGVDVRLQAVHTRIERVVVGGGEQVEAGPEHVFGHLR